MTAEHFLLAFGRATLFTSASAVVAWLLFRIGRIESPRIHRTAWLLVVVQGWLLFPWVWQIETPPIEAVAAFAKIERSTIPMSPVDTLASINVARAKVGEQLDWDRAALAISVAWFAGATLLALSRVRRYFRFVRQVPAREANADGDWQREWQQQLHATRIRQRVELRMTGDLGPLLCYVPFRYIVLVPRALWSALARGERQVILRHELAHLARGDLWWALAIRLLALPQWFNPLVWRAVRSFDEAGEWACDDLVARRGRGHELLFARSLLATAEYATSAAPGTLAMQGGELSRRIRRLVSRRFTEETMAKRLWVLVPLAAIAAAQSVRIEYVEAAPTNTVGEARSGDSSDESVNSTAKPLRNRYGNVPYIIEPQDVLSIGRVTLIGTRRIEEGDLPTGRLLVWPEGRINLGSFGDVYVRGMTVNQAQLAIKKQLLAAKKFNDVEFDLHVDSVNSKKVYVILQGVGQGDFAQGIVCSSGTTVSKVLHSAVWPQPVDLKAAKIWVARPAPRGIGHEQILPVNWEDVSNEKPMATNYELHPCDRLFISTGKEDPENPPMRMRKTEFSPAKSLYSPHAEMELRSAALALPKSSTRIQFEIDIIEDRGDNLAEFNAKRIDAHFVTFDTETIRPALRVLAKHSLIKKRMSPKLTCLEGQAAMLSMVADDRKNSPVQALALNVYADVFEGGLMLQLSLTTSCDGKHYKFDSSVPVKLGRSVLIQANAEDGLSPAQDATALYVFLTPSIVDKTASQSTSSSYYQYLEPPTAE